MNAYVAKRGLLTILILADSNGKIAVDAMVSAHIPEMIYSYIFVSKDIEENPNEIRRNNANGLNIS